MLIPRPLIDPALPPTQHAGLEAGRARSVEMGTINESLGDLVKAKSLADPSERNAVLANVLARLVSNHLRLPPGQSASEHAQYASEHVSARQTNNQTH